MFLDKEKAYFGSDLYLPKECVNVGYLKNSLILKEGRKSHKLYRELKKRRFIHLACKDE
jgi:hypothetical protein